MLIGGFLVFRTRGRVGALVGVVGVVDRDSGGYELLAWPVRVSKRDEILDNVQLRISFIYLHGRLQRKRSRPLRGYV
jgi:hypothetical protein